MASSFSVNCGLANLLVVKLAPLLAADCFVWFAFAFLSLTIKKCHDNVLTTLNFGMGNFCGILLV